MQLADPLQISPVSHCPLPSCPQSTAWPQLFVTTPHLFPEHVVVLGSGLQQTLPALQTWPVVQHAAPHIVFGQLHVVPEHVSFVMLQVEPHATVWLQLLVTFVLQLFPHAALVDSGVQQRCVAVSHACPPHAPEQSRFPPHPLSFTLLQVPA